MRALLDLLYPPRCAGCDLPGVLLCERCAAEVARIDPASACPRCGAPDGVARCAECAGRTFVFGAARCAAVLAPPVSRAVVVLKDGGERRYASVLAGLLAEAVADGWFGPDDALVPVPASPEAVRRRGFDHALDVARSLSADCGTPLMCVLRSASTADQRELRREQRFANRTGAFTVTADAPMPPRIVLVDDVFTTGATFDAAARVLTAAGATDVRALAVARACSAAPGA